MKELLVGEIIKRKREEIGLSQWELCEGICDPVTLSRLENGRQSPSRNNVIALLERLGLPDDRYYALLTQSENDYEGEIKEIKAKIIELNKIKVKENYRIEDIEIRISEIKKRFPVKDKISIQTVMMLEADLKKAANLIGYEEYKLLMLKALKMTVPNFTIDKLLKYRYTSDEIRILCVIASTNQYLGKIDLTLNMYEDLYNYMKKNAFRLSGYPKMMSLVLHNYCINLMKSDRFEQAIKIAEEGRCLAVSRGIYQQLPGFLSILADAFYAAGKIDDSRECYLQAHYLYKAFEDRRNQSGLDKELTNRFPSIEI